MMKPRCTNECAEDFKRIEAEKAALVMAAVRRKGEFAWLIEKGSGADLRYYAPTEPGEWTADNLKACRFARKEDAEAIQFRHVQRGHLPVYGSRVCEHGWH